MPDSNPLPRPHEVVPNPDPSVMTTAQLDRTIVGLTENISAKFEAITTRLDGMDKATTTLHEDMVRVPTILDREIKSARELLESKLEGIDKVNKEQHEHLTNVMNEKFARVDVLFVEGDKRTQQLSTANALALAAALQAAKEAVAEQNRSNTTAIAKSETAVSEQIKQMQVTFETGLRSTNEKIDDIKSRLDKGEGGLSGVRESTRDNRLDHGILIQLLLFGVAVVAVMVTIIEIFRH